MSAFEFVFSLFGLLLGLSLAEVLGGFSRAVKARRQLRIGWLTPLLGLLVMLDVTSFWITAWSLRDAMPVKFWLLLVVLAFTGLYYLAASLIFPDDPESVHDLDNHYFENRRYVLGAMLLVNVPNYLNDALGVRMFTATPFLTAMGVAFVVLATVTVFAKSTRANLVLLLLLVALYPVGAIEGALNP